MSNHRTAIAVLAALFPIAAFADISGSLTLNANSSVNMDSATIVTSGPDFTWNGTTLTPQGGAKAFANAALTGSSTYNLLTASLISSEASLGTTAPISGLAANSIVVYLTNGGNFGKLLVTTNTGGTLTFQYTTYESTTPVISGVLNNYSYLVPGLPNSGLAPGTLFIVTGKNLASATTVTALQDPSKGIPTSLNGATVTVTVGGVSNPAPIYYAIGKQIAAVLPSNTPAGAGTVTVNYTGQASNAYSIKVVPSSLGLDTYYGTGSGLGVATNATTGALYSYTNSIPPGTTVVLWGSGLGNTGDSDTTNTSTPHQVSNPPTFYIGGQAVTPLYAGRSVYPGVNQINLTIPSSTPTGCGVSVVAVSGSGSSAIVSNSVTLPIGTGVCSDPLLGYNGNQIVGGGQTGNYTAASLGVSQGTTSKGTQTQLFGSFQSYTGVTSGGSTNSVVSLGSCYVTTSGGSVSLPTGTSAGLDAGTITMNGPAGSMILTPVSIPIPGQTGPSGIYGGTVANSVLPATGGTFTFTGAGGKDVGSFNVSASIGNLINWTNQSSITSVTRSAGQLVTWTGGTPSTFVYVGGTSSTSDGSASASFVCYAQASAGQLNVPSYVLLALPTGSGTLGITNSGTPGSFTASGLTSPGTAFIGVSFSSNLAYN